MTSRRNRIVEHRIVKGRDLLPNPANWRTHPPDQRAATTAVLDRLGYVDELKVVDTPDGLMLMDGHLRADIGAGDDIPIAIVDLTPEEQVLFLATFDPLAAMAITDHPAFEALAETIAQDDDVLMRLLEGVREHDSPLVLGGRVERDQHSTAEKVKLVESPDYVPVTKGGQVWQLGDHRLMCGDATSAEDVARLMDQGKATCVFTDPPYMIMGSSTGAKSDPAISRPFFRAMWVAISAIAPTDVYVCCDWRSFPTIQVEAHGWDVKDIIVWDKQSGGLGKPYRRRHEFLMFARRASSDTKMFGRTSKGPAITDDDVWAFPRDTQHKEHNAQKPVPLVERALSNSTATGDVVADPFVGSGTTIIAAHNLGRRCYAMEIEPRYCDVVIQRWEAYTGAKAELLG